MHKDTFFSFPDRESYIQSLDLAREYTMHTVEPTLINTDNSCRLTPSTIKSFSYSPTHLLIVIFHLNHLFAKKLEFRTHRSRRRILTMKSYEFTFA